LTLAISIILSAVNALTLSPALCAIFLKPHSHEEKQKNFLERFFTNFNIIFDRMVKKYTRGILFLLRKKWIAFAGLAVFTGVFVLLMNTTPKSFVPSEDMGGVFMDKHAEGATIKEKLKNSPLVELILSDGSKYDEKGKIESISGLVDPNTGSFSMRATFPNPKGLIRSGYSATVQLPNNLENVIIIPQSATYELQGKVLVYVIGKDNKVKSTEIKVEDLPDGLTYAVTSGLKAGDKVVVEGIGLLKDETVVVPKETTLQNVIARK